MSMFHCEALEPPENVTGREAFELNEVGRVGLLL